MTDNGLIALNISEEFHPFIKNLNARAEAPDRMPFIDREKELVAVMETLLRKLKNNLILIGKPGVGKTALITELASRINRGAVPPSLKNKLILELEVNSFVYSNESPDLIIKQLEKFFQEMCGHRERIILFLDEVQLQSIAGLPSSNQLHLAQDLLKTHLANRELTIIAAAPPEDYYKFVKSDEILAASFSTVVIDEPGPEEMLRILQGVQKYFEGFYNLKIPAALFDNLFTLSQRYIPHRAFPDKAFELLDIACSKAALKYQGVLDIEYVYQSVSSITHLPIEIIQKDYVEHYRGITNFLSSVLVNQAKALEEISRIIKLSKLNTDINHLRPEGIFLFLGPTGSGKSYVAAKIAAYLFGSEEKLRIIDLAGYKKASDVKKLVGNEDPDSPGVWIREIEDHPFSVILFENIAASHPTVLDFIGKTLDKGVVLDTFGKRHYLSGIIFILSLTQIGEAKRESAIGFVGDDNRLPEIIISEEIMNVLDWVDEVILFTPLTMEHLHQIAGLKIAELTRELEAKYQCRMTVEKAVLDYIALGASQTGKFAHAVSDFIEREIRLKIIDMATRSNKKIAVQVKMKEGAVEIVCA